MPKRMDAGVMDHARATERLPTEDYFSEAKWQCSAYQRNVYTRSGLKNDKSTKVFALILEFQTNECYYTLWFISRLGTRLVIGTLVEIPYLTYLALSACAGISKGRVT